MSPKSNSSGDPEASITHEENPKPSSSKWKLSKKANDGDTALALFADPGEVEEYNDPKELKALLRKIDFMILPYLAICYAFFYIDKVRQKLLFSRDKSNAPFYPDNIELCSDFRNSRRPQSPWNAVQLVKQHLLFWIPSLGIPYEPYVATIPSW